MNAAPNPVSAAPPPPSPPVAVATAGCARQRLVSSTSIHARRYDMPSERAAAEIEPVAAIASSSAILPGPIASAAPPFVASTWKRTSGLIVGLARDRRIAGAVAVERHRLDERVHRARFDEAELRERAPRDPRDELRLAHRDLDVDGRPGHLADRGDAALEDVEDADARRSLQRERHVARADPCANA